MESLDMTEILLDAYRLADQINESEEVKQYLVLQQQLQADPEAQRFIVQFQQVKERYAEAQRFGIFHPNYHQAKEEARVYQEQMRHHPLIGDFLEAEERLNQLLFQVSSLIANSVSDTIKVPSDNPQVGKKAKKKCGD